VPFKREVALKLGATHAAAGMDEATELARSMTNGQGADSAIVTGGLASTSGRRPAPVSAVRLRQIIREQTWLCAPAGHLSRSAGDQRLAAVSATPRRRWEFEGLQVLAALTAAGVGVTFLPASIVSGQAGVAALPLSPRMHRDILVLTRTTTRHDPAIGACLQIAQEALGSPAQCRQGVMASPRIRSA
jgi:hypothetical protein